MDGNFFFVVGIVLVIAAVGLAFLGIRESDRFPASRALMVGGIVLFAAVVATTMAFAVVKSKDEQDKRNAELAKEEPQPEASGTRPGPPGPRGPPRPPGHWSHPDHRGHWSHWSHRDPGRVLARRWGAGLRSERAHGEAWERDDHL